MQNCRRERIPSSLRPKAVGLQDLGGNNHRRFSPAVSLLGGQARQSICSFYLRAKPPSQMCVLTCKEEESKLKYFYQPLFNPCKARLGGKLRIFLTRVHSPTDTRSSPFHNPALPEPFPAHIKLFFLSAPSPHTQHIPFMCTDRWPYLSLSP